MEVEEVWWEGGLRLNTKGNSANQQLHFWQLSAVALLEGVGACGLCTGCVNECMEIGFCTHFATSITHYYYHCENPPYSRFSFDIYQNTSVNEKSF